jgi:hypothetical protein
MLARPATAGQATFEPDDEDLAPDDEEPDDLEPAEPEDEDEDEDEDAAAGLSAFLSPDDVAPSFPASLPPPESGELAEPEPFSEDPVSTFSFLAPALESVW